MTSPRYQDVVSREIPEIVDDAGTVVRVVCGRFWGKTGPVDGIAADPRYLDVRLPPNARTELSVELSHNAFAYVFEGSASFRDASPAWPIREDSLGPNGEQPGAGVSNRMVVHFDRGDGVSVNAEDGGVRFLLVSGAEIREPVAWQGPIVMNTQEELRQAYRELKEGTFIKSG